jgi:hypothetical protein
MFNDLGKVSITDLKLVIYLNYTDHNKETP